MYMFKLRRYCGFACQSAAMRKRPEEVTRGIASRHARRLKPAQPCERCGTKRRSQVHHKDRNYLNNALENLERLCHWCHMQEHAPEIQARSARGWQTRRERYGTGGHS